MLVRHGYRTWCAALLLTSVACHDELRDRLVSSLEGTAIVENETPQWGADNGWTIGDAPSLAIGREDGPQAYIFGRISQVLELSEGWLVVDSDAAELRVFDKSGVHIRTIGREGRGPGEFLQVSGVLLSEDSLLVLDGAMQRLSVLTTDGQVVRTVELEPTGDPYFPLRLYRLMGTLDGNLVLMAKAWPSDMRPQPVTYWDAGETLLYTPDGKRKGVVGEPSGMDTYSTPQRAGGVVYGRYSSGAVANQTIAMTDGGSPEFRMYDRVGPPRAVVRWNVPRVRVNADIVQEFREVRGDPQWGAAEYNPVVSNLIGDSEGSIWVEPWSDRWAESSNRQRAWQVFSDDGRWLGEVMVPSHLRPEVINRTSVAGVWRDPRTGVETVRVYPLRR